MSGFLFGFNAINLFQTGLFIGEDTTGKTVFLLALAGCIVAYLCGSINSAVLISRGLFGKDIRKYGSGNAGLTNMLRVFGKKGAVLTLIGDMAKAVVAILCGMLLAGYLYGGFTALLFCVIGHAFPCFFEFRGGKGVLSAATGILCLSPATFCVVIGLFLVMVLTTRYVSVGSITAAFFFPLCLNAFLTAAGKPDFIVLSCALLTCLLVIFLHRENVRRLLGGTEKKLGQKEPPKEEQE